MKALVLNKFPACQDGIRFTEEMIKFIGKEIEVEFYPRTINWFMNRDSSHIFHYSWLQFLEKETEKMKVTLTNGMTVEGDAAQIKEVIEKLGLGFKPDGIHYWSESKGWTLIKDMNTMHLRNAILKQYEIWVDQMHEITNPQKVIKYIQDGIEDITWLAMVKEYSTREEG
jgi:hypothetical protein